LTSITVDAQFRPGHGWICIALVLDGVFTLDMLLSGYHHSIIRRDVLPTLPHLFRSTRPGYFEMLKVSLGEEPIIGLEVRPSPLIQRLGADGMLGMDFLERFTDVHLDVRRLRLTFSGP
jgi:hypothetical protein